MCLLAIAEDLSLSFASGGGIEISRSLLILIVLLFSGYASSRWGKIRILSLGLAWISLGMILYSGARGYTAIMLAMGFVGAGSGFIEALITPLVQDLHPRTAVRHMSITHAFFSVGVCAAVLIIGEFLTAGMSWRIILTIMGVLSFGTTVMFVVSSRGIKLPKSSHSRYHIDQIVCRKRFYLLGAAMFISGSLESAYTFWIASYMQLHFSVTPRLSGVGTACFAAGMAVGRFAAARLSKYYSLSTLVMGSACVGICVGIIAQIISGVFLFMCVLFAAGLSIACYWPALQVHAAKTMKGVDYTILFIYLSCFGIAGFGVTPYIMGVIGDAYSLQKAFAIVPIFSSVMLILMGIERIRTMYPGSSRR